MVARLATAVAKDHFVNVYFLDSDSLASLKRYPRNFLHRAPATVKCVLLV